MNNKAVIVGKDHHNALGVVESLGRKGVRPYIVILTKHKKSYVAHSKYVEQGWCCPDEESVIKVLLEHFDDGVNKAIAYACDDETATILDRHHAELEPYLFLPTVKEAGTLSEWMQKERMTKLAQEVGMTVPKTWVLKDNKIPEGVVFPIITKAHSSVEGGKDNIHICNDKEALEGVLKNNHCETMVLQQFVSKVFEFQMIGYSGGGYYSHPRTHKHRAA